MKVTFISLLALSLLAVVLSGCAAASVLPIDSDSDGIADSDDRCPATSSDSGVDRYGCADSDSDGIIDSVDHCPGTPLSSAVDQFGCLDSDNDGVKNGQDQCSRTRAGERVMHNGCSARQTVNLESIRFDYGGVEITPEARERLSRVSEVLKLSPQFRLALQGHSDNSGSATFNYRLSRHRANAVMTVLLDLGVPRERIDIQAYGAAMPIADNNTEEGRARNRRVALRVIRADSVK